MPRSPSYVRVCILQKDGAGVTIHSPDVQQTFKGHVPNGPFVVPLRERVIAWTHAWWPEQRWLGAA